MSQFTPKDIDALRHFRFERILNEGLHSLHLGQRNSDRLVSVDPVAHGLTILGTLPDGEDKRSNAIIRVEKSALPSQQARTLITHFLKDVQLMESNDIVSRFL